jgi:hypothetical protein
LGANSGVVKKLHKRVIAAPLRDLSVRDAKKRVHLRIINVMPRPIALLIQINLRAGHHINLESTYRTRLSWKHHEVAHEKLRVSSISRLNTQPLTQPFLGMLFSPASVRPTIALLHKESRNESQAISSLCRATLSVTPECFLGLLDSSSLPHPSSLLAFIFQLGRLPSSDVTRYHRYYAPIRHPNGPA